MYTPAPTYLACPSPRQSSVLDQGPGPGQGVWVWAAGSWGTGYPAAQKREGEGESAVIAKHGLPSFPRSGFVL